MMAQTPRWDQNHPASGTHELRSAVVKACTCRVDPSKTYREAEPGDVGG